MALNGLPFIYAGRGSRWGNPFKVVRCHDNKWTITTHKTLNCLEILDNNSNESGYATKEEAVMDAIKCYRVWIRPHIDEARKTLPGNNLACWCNLKDNCHVDVLIDVVTPKMIIEFYETMKGLEKGQATKIGITKNEFEKMYPE